MSSDVASYRALFISVWVICVVRGYILFLVVMSKRHRPLTISIHMEDNWRQNRIVSQYSECFLFAVVVRVDTESRKLDLIHTSM